MKHLTVLSFGGGQDSTAILYKLVYDQAFRAKYASGDLIVIMADTNDEHPTTVEHVKKTKTFCEIRGIEFYHITASMGYHKGNWKGLREFYHATTTVGSKCYPKTCTDHLKLRPIFNFIEDYLSKKLNVPSKKKSIYKVWTKEAGKLRVIIGIAAGEEKRIADPAKDPQKWHRENVETIYPLVDLGMDREGCQKYIASTGNAVPTPSNCILCPFMSEQELLWLKRNYPADLQEWIEIEAAKLAKWEGKTDKNFGVWGKKTLVEKLAEVEVKYGSWTDEQLNEYKFSHGHCLSKY